MIIGLVDHVHVRDELIDPENCGSDASIFMLSDHGRSELVCRTHDRFEIIRPA